MCDYIPSVRVQNPAPQVHIEHVRIQCNDEDADEAEVDNDQYDDPSRTIPCVNTKSSVMHDHL